MVCNLLGHLDMDDGDHIHCLKQLEVDPGRFLEKYRHSYIKGRNDIRPDEAGCEGSINDHFGIPRKTDSYNLALNVQSGGK